MKILNIIFIVTLLCCGCMAEGIQKNLLINTKWIIEGNEEKEIIEFNKDSLIHTMVYTTFSDTLAYSKAYYLSNIIPATFNIDLVGQNTKGKYLVAFNKKTKCVDYCEIKELTEDSLVLFYKKQPNNIGGADMTFTYKRVK